MPCPPSVPISIIPPVSKGVGPLVWANGSQVARLNVPLNPSWLVYDGSVTRWGDGSANAPVLLPALQEVSAGVVKFVLGVNSNGTLVKSGNITLPTLATSPSYANDSAAASGGVVIGQLYRNGSVVQIRVN